MTTVKDAIIGRTVRVQNYHGKTCIVCKSDSDKQIKSTQFCLSSKGQIKKKVLKRGFVTYYAVLPGDIVVDIWVDKAGSYTFNYAKVLSITNGYAELSIDNQPVTEEAYSTPQYVYEALAS